MMSEADDRFREIREIYDRLNRDGFSQLKGEPKISPELEFAISTLLKLRYRDVDKWKFHLTYEFTDHGVRVRTSVEGYNGADIIRFTEEEAIAIANIAAAKHLNQPE